MRWCLQTQSWKHNWPLHNGPHLSTLQQCNNISIPWSFCRSPLGQSSVNRMVRASPSWPSRLWLSLDWHLILLHWKSSCLFQLHWRWCGRKPAKLTSSLPSKCRCRCQKLEPPRVLMRFNHWKSAETTVSNKKSLLSQKSRFASGSAAEAWRSFPAAELATSSENSIRTPSLAAVALCLQGTTNAHVHTRTQ